MIRFQTGFNLSLMIAMYAILMITILSYWYVTSAILTFVTLTVAVFSLSLKANGFVKIAWLRWKSKRNVKNRLQRGAAKLGYKIKLRNER